MRTGKGLAASEYEISAPRSRLSPWIGRRLAPGVLVLAAGWLLVAGRLGVGPGLHLSQSPGDSWFAQPWGLSNLPSISRKTNRSRFDAWLRIWKAMSSHETRAEEQSGSVKCCQVPWSTAVLRRDDITVDGSCLQLKVLHRGFVIHPNPNPNHQPCIPGVEESGAERTSERQGKLK